MRGVLALIAGGLLVVLLLFAVRAETPATLASPGPAATAIAATSTPTATPTSPTVVYVNPKWKFTLALPGSYRHSDRLSSDTPGSSRPAASDVFTARSPDEEARLAGRPCETACEVWNYVLTVQIFTGTGSQSPRDFYTQFSYARDQQIEDLTVDGHPAVRVTNGATYQRQIVVKDGDRMFVVAYEVYPSASGFSVPAGASREQLEAILASFKLVP